MSKRNENPDSLSRDEMVRAFMERDRSYDGLFYAGVTSTMVFCKPSCPARKPRPERVELFGAAREALFAGFRPCRRCRPLESTGRTPAWFKTLIGQVEAEPSRRIRDAELAEQGLDPAVVRRYFKRAYGMTFQAYSRARRLGEAFSSIRRGASIDEAVFDHGWESHSGFREAFGKLVEAPPGSVRRKGRTHGGAHGDLCDGERGGCVRLAWIETPLGPMVAGATERAVCLLEFTDRRMLEAQMETVRRRFGVPLLPGGRGLLERLERELGEYFAGARTAFDLPLDYPGTDFQRRVWQALLRIPYGRTRSYAEIARAMGSPGAARAVGRANGLNRISILIPCHRVVGADGELGGYGGGLWRKLRLLETEGAVPGEGSASDQDRATRSHSRA